MLALQAVGRERLDRLPDDVQYLPLGEEMSRRRVLREERVGPTPETLAKLRPWTLRTLLEAGDLDAAEFESILQIVSAYKLITSGVGHKPVDYGREGGKGNGSMSPGQERLCAVYRAWGCRFTPGAFIIQPGYIVAWAEDELPIDSWAKHVLRGAARQWDKEATAYDDARRAERDTVHGMAMED
jgi:hypothetical protein